MAAPDDDDEMSTAELELYARKAIKRILRDSQPEIVANSDGRDAAAYHAPAAAPPVAVDSTTPNGEVELSETLQREIDGGSSAPARSASSQSATETTVLVGPSAARDGGKPRLLWIAAAVGLVALAIGAVALGRGGHSSHRANAASAAPPATSLERASPLGPAESSTSVSAGPTTSDAPVSPPVETASPPPRVPNQPPGKRGRSSVPPHAAASTSREAYPQTL